MQATIVSGEAQTVTAVAAGERLLIDPEDLPAALGWEWKREGLCRGNVCVPVRDRERMLVGDRLDVGAVAGALGLLAVVDAPARIAALSLPAEMRNEAIREHRAPDFALNDLDGVEHHLDEWRGTKKLLVAFASW